MNTDIQVSEIQHVREIVRVFSREEIAQCIDEQIAIKNNSCAIEGENIQVMNVLSRASIVRQLVNDGATLPEAIRELGRRMRGVLELK